MPRRWFVCPDGEQVEIDQCLKSCRMAQRCAPSPYLRMAAEWRPWSGKASVTMLERCLRQTWLEQRVDFGESPDRSAFRIVGTRGHAALEERSEEGDWAEEFLNIKGIRGVTDLVEEDNGEWVMTDYKVMGSFAVAKCLGITDVGFKDVLDSEGNPVMYVRGPKAGQPKQEKVYGVKEGKADTSQYEVQLNLYRIAWEAKHKPKKISRMQIFAIVRDGGLYIAKSRGVDRNTYVIPIPKVDDAVLLGWAQSRRAEIEEAMAQDILPPVGTAKETWDGAFCRGYCPMRDECAKAGDNPWLGGSYEDTEE